MLELKRKRVLAQQEAELILKAREERLEALREKVSLGPLTFCCSLANSWGCSTGESSSNSDTLSTGKIK